MKRLVAPFLNNWFLIGLIALALCAIPGVIIVILRLCWNADRPINEWLLETFQISYDLRVSPWIALVLLLLPLLLVLLYFLRLKRKPIQVPSTFLWKKSIEDLHVNSLFQWLRNNILLLVQLLVLLFLIYSVLGVRIHGTTGTSRHYILMIDNSASMSATDVAPSRLDWAKAEAIKEIDAASDADSGMVIVFNSKATTLQTYTNDKEKLRDAVRGIQPTQRSTRIEEALALAESLANPVRSTEDTGSQPVDVVADQQRTMVQARGIETTVHLYSDGRFPRLSEATLAGFNARLAGNASALGNLNLHYHQAGKLDEPGNTNNVAIVGINVQKQQFPGKKAAAGDKVKMLAFVRVANYRAAKAAVRLRLDVYDMKLDKDAVKLELRHPLQQDVTIPERKYVEETVTEEEKDEPGEAGPRFLLPPMEPGRPLMLHAYLDKANDDFPLDDEAWLVVGTTRKAKVLVVGTPNKALEANLGANEAIAVSERMAPEELTSESYRKKARNAEYDWVIFDRCAPAEEADLPLANTWFIDRPPPPWTRGDVLLKSPLAIPSKQQHPALKHLTTVWDVRISEAFAFDLKKNLTPKAAAELELADGDPKKRSLPTLTRIIETSNQLPLLFTMPRGPHTDLVMTFELFNAAGDVNSNWPFEVSFPLFFKNILHILGNVDEAKGALSIAPGDPIVLRPEAGFAFIDVTAPDKHVTRLERRDRNDVLFADTERLGFYSYRVGGRSEARLDPLVRGFAVNLLDLNESNIEPRSSIRIGSERIAAGAEKFQTREVWKWILLVALVLLVAEWLIYHRRIAV